MVSGNAVHLARNVLTVALPVHRLQDLEWNVDDRANPRKTLTERPRIHLEKHLFLLSKQRGLPGLNSIYSASRTFIFCHCKKVS